MSRCQEDDTGVLCALVAVKWLTHLPRRAIPHAQTLTRCALRRILDSGSHHHPFSAASPPTLANGDTRLPRRHLEGLKNLHADISQTSQNLLHPTILSAQLHLTPPHLLTSFHPLPPMTLFRCHPAVSRRQAHAGGTPAAPAVPAPAAHLLLAFRAAAQGAPSMACSFTHAFCSLEGQRWQMPRNMKDSLFAHFRQLGYRCPPELS